MLQATLSTLPESVVSIPLRVYTILHYSNIERCINSDAVIKNIKAITIIWSLKYFWMHDTMDNCVNLLKLHIQYCSHEL